MKLEKDKIYKVKHNSDLFDEDYPRDYIIFSPLMDVTFPDDFFNGFMTKSKIDFKEFNTNFTICFDGYIKTSFGNKPSGTSVDRQCIFLPLIQEDYEDIRRAIAMIGDGCVYNRKLNKLVYNAKKRTNI